MISQSSRLSVLLSAICLLVSTSAIAVDSTWVGSASGTWTNAANWSAGIPQTSNDTATLNGSVTITVPTNVTVKTLTVNAPATITVASGATLAFSNAGGDVLVANATCLVDGAGDLTFSMYGSTGTDYANIKPASGVTLTLAARIAASGNSGVELNSAGTLLLTHTNNTFAGYARVSVANGTIAFSDPAALGLSAVGFDGNPSKFVFTGTAAAPLSLPIPIAAANATFQHAGTGTLTLNGSVFSSSAGGKALTFDMPGTGAVVTVNGSITNGTGTLSLYDSGAGTLILNGTLSYLGTSSIRAKRVLNGNASAATGAYAVEQGGVLTIGSAGVINGAITVNSGGTLAVKSGATFLNRTLSLNTGSTLSLNPAAADGFAVTLPLTNTLNEAGVRWVIPAAATASAATVPNLIRTANATLDVAASNMGSPSNTLFIQNFTPGPLPAWFTVNGLPAAYDAARGVIPTTAAGATYPLTALGPSVVPNDSTAAAVINAAGTEGGITLAANPTAVFSLTQDHTDNPATVDLGGQTLAASVVAVTANGNSLTLTNGTLTAPSSLSAPSGGVSLPSLPTAPIAWFDLADASTVTTDAVGRISLLANKGSLGTNLNAVVPSGNLGPRYVPNAVAGLGVARSDGIEPPQGLATLGNASVTGTAARTVFLVAMRSAVSQNAFYALYMGADANNNESFALVERTYETSFVTMGNDLPGALSPAGHNVLTFITGQGGVPNAGEGFRNGVSLGTKTFALATVDNPIRLLHRPVTSKAISGPGEVAEALVFNYTLSGSDRAAVEAYLMQKWKLSATRADTLLALRNDNPAAGLAVPAAVADPYAATLALTKSGPGPVTLGGPLAYSGSTLILDGALVLDTPAGLTNALAGIVAGSGSLVKKGPGGLALSKTSAYAGGTSVQSGTLLPGANGSLGSGPVSVQSNAVLDIANAAIGGAAAFANAISISGSGPDGLGALRNSHPRNDQQSAFKSVALTGDAAVYAKSRFDVRSGTFDFGGHSLTVNGGGQFSIVSSAITNVTSATAVNVAQGLMDFEASDLKGSSASSVNVAPGAVVNLLGMTAPVQWSLQLTNNATLRASNGGVDTNLNQWAGPVTLGAGTARVTAGDLCSTTVTGPVGGNGGLLKDGLGWLWLLNTANNYGGATAVTQGTLYAVSPGLLGASGPTALTVFDGATFIARTASAAFPNGWTDAKIRSIADPAVFKTPAATLGIDTVSGDFDYTGDLPYAGLRKLGTYKLRLSGTATNLGALAIYDGELDLTGTGSHNLHGYSATVGASTNATSVAVLRLAGTTLKTDDPGSNRSGPALYVGSAASARGVAYVGTNAAANGRLTVGNDAGSAGAVYQTAGVVTNTGGTANDAALGVNGYGYYRLDNGTLANKGSTQLGRNSGSTGVFEQRGGNLVINPGLAPADGVVGDYYNGTLTTRGGVGVFLLSGGTCSLNGHSLTLGDWVNVNSYSNGTGVLTLEGSAQADMSNIILANRNGDAQGYVNLNGGSLTTSYFQKGGNNSNANAVAAISFNSGALRVPSTANAVSALVRTSANNTPALLNVYAGGAVIDTFDAAVITLDHPLRAPANFGVSGVTVSSAGAGYIAPPAVTFSGGSGTGATAVAEINLGSGTLTAIRVTSPGVGYTTAPTVTLRGGGYTASAVASATLGLTASGGFTKLGAGVLNITVPCTYTGPTVVSNGLLRLSAGGQTLASASVLTVAGGTLDLAGSTLTNNNSVVLAGGRLVNGTVSAPAFVKTGSGAATLSAAPARATATALHTAYIRSLNPLVWYDPSDAATVTLDGTGRITALLNKGSKSGMDAVNGFIYTGATVLSAPLLATGALSYAVSGLPTIKIDGNDRGLGSGSNLSITGFVARTVVTVVTRDSTNNSAVVCFGAPLASQLFEVGDRLDSSKVVIGGYSADLTMNSNPAQQVNIVTASLTAPKVSEAWRTGVTPNHAAFTNAANFNTADSRFYLGQRAGQSKGSEFRGQIGETLVFDRVLTDGECTELQRLLTLKWMTAQAPDSGATTIPVSVAQGTLRLAPGADAIARLAPAVWYDPSDAASVTTNAAGRVTGILNKGTRASAMNAVVRGGYQGPLLASGTNSYSAAGKPMLKIDNNNSNGLESASNTGISGTAPRTLIAVLSRDATAGDQQATVALGDQSVPRAMFELTDRNSGSCFGNNSDDLSISPVLSATNANVYMMDSTATNLFTGWRSGGLPNKVSKTLGGNWATVDTRLCVGYRSTLHRDTFRGQIGEVLLFDRLLTEAERADLEDYLVNKWTRPGGADGLFNGAVFNVAAGATLDLGGARTNITVTGTGAVTNGTLGTGFVISPAGDSALGELALSGVTFTAGAQYRLTTSGNSSDRLLIDGDLSALTVVPATGAQITGKTFVIATGAITRKPALSGFPDKFLLRKQGNDLLLTTAGGALLLLK